MHRTYTIYGENEESFEKLLQQYRWDVALREWSFEPYTNTYEAVAEHFNANPDFASEFTAQHLGTVSERVSV